MHQYFWRGTNLGTFLFEGYQVNGFWAFASTCLGLAALSVIYEALKIAKLKLQAKTVKSILDRTAESASLTSHESDGLLKSLSTNRNKFLVIQWATEVMNWTVHVTVGYILMLAIMTFNVWILIAVICGSGLGYFVFGPILVETSVAKTVLKRQQKMERCERSCAGVSNNDPNLRRESMESVISPEQHITQSTIVESVQVHNS